MLRSATPFLSALLVLGLALGAFAHGYAQVQAPAPDLHELEICGETGLETIFVDDEGELVDPDACADSLCMDCLRVSGTLASSVAQSHRHETASALTGAHLADHASRPMNRMAHQPRAPPSLKQA